MFTFTTMGNFGQYGPKSTQTYANYPFSNFSIINGQQQWVVPQTGAYTITAAGARGALPGRIVQGTFSLIAGQTVSILVGQLPYPLVQQNNLTLGGGGGTFVVLENTPLVIASGGDGSTSGLPGQFSGSGGTSGAGYTSNGISADPFVSYNYPSSYTNGGAGSRYTYSQSRAEGGFGGGQAPYNLPISVSKCIGNGTIATVSTSIPHGYPNIYYVKINIPSFNGNYLIKSTSSNTFTFNSNVSGSAFTGNVTSVFSGVPGGGGYRGGSGATCYGNVTDLGPIANTAGYVTVTLVGTQPPPIQPWNTSWYSVSQYLPNSVARTWSPLLNKYVAMAVNATPIVSIGDNSFPPVTNLKPYPFLSIACSPSGNLVTSNGYTSTDGINWTQGNLTRNVGSYVNYLNGQFVATFSLQVDSNADLTSICISPDGYNWSFLTSDTPVYYITAYGTGKYIGIVTDGSVDYLYLAYSTNLTHWTVVDTSTYWQSVDFGNGVFVACGYDYYSLIGTVKYSTDGITWNSANVSSSYEWSAVKFTSSGFNIFANPYETAWGTYASSQDGIHWVLNSTQNISPGTNPLGLGVIGAYWIGYSPTANATFQLGGPVFTLKGTLIWSEFAQVQYYPQSIAWSSSIGTYVTANQKPNGSEFSIGYGNQEIILPGTVGDNVLVISWSNELAIFVVYSPSRFLYTSPDGQTWTSQPAPTFSTQCNPFWVKELGIFTTGSATSPDGIYWTSTSGPLLYSIAWNGNTLVGGDGSKVYTSSNGTTWSGSTLPVSGVAYANGLFVAVGLSGATLFIYTSNTSGSTWTQTYSTSVQVNNLIGTAPPSLIVWAPEIAQFIVTLSVSYLTDFSAQFYYTILFSSPDGIQWTKLATPDLTYSLSVYKVTGIVWTGERLLAISRGSSGVFFSN